MSPQKIIAETDSTQNEIKAWLVAQPDLLHLSWVRADSQTHGRGRQGRGWISEPKNLQASIWYRLDQQKEAWSKSVTWFPLWVGSRLLEALIQLGVPPDRVRLKWPNDIVVDQRDKIAGILCEKQAQGVVVGVGINLEVAPILDPGAAYRAISLRQLGLSESARSQDHVMAAFISSLIVPFDLVTLKASLQRYLVPQPGDAIAWADGVNFSHPQTGTVLRLGGFGELVVMNESGQEHDLFGEEVRLLRPDSLTKANPSRG